MNKFVEVRGKDNFGAAIQQCQKKRATISVWGFQDQDFENPKTEAWRDWQLPAESQRLLGETDLEGINRDWLKLSHKCEDLLQKQTQQARAIRICSFLLVFSVFWQVFELLSR